jgi:hypothetical protein
MEVSDTGSGSGTSRKNLITCCYPILTQAILRNFFNQNPLLAANITFLVVVLQAKGNMLYKEGECDRPADGKGEGDIPKTRV